MGSDDLGGPRRASRAMDEPGRGAGIRCCGARTTWASRIPAVYRGTAHRPEPAVRGNLDRLLGMAAKADPFAVIAFRIGPGARILGFPG